MRPQLLRLNADTLCLQEVNGQEEANQPRHLLISRNLLEYFKRSEVHNELLHDETIAFATDIEFSESDHAPAVVELELP